VFGLGEIKECDMLGEKCCMIMIMWIFTIILLIFCSQNQLLLSF